MLARCRRFIFFFSPAIAFLACNEMPGMTNDIANGFQRPTGNQDQTSRCETLAIHQRKRSHGRGEESSISSLVARQPAQQSGPEFALDFIEAFLVLAAPTCYFGSK